MAQPSGDGGSNRIWWIVAAGASAAWILYLTLFLPKTPREGGLSPPALRAPVPPQIAEYDWLARDLNDQPVSFAQFKGKAAFVNVWATWCPPCVAELPSIANLAGNPRLKDVAFVCLSTDESAGTLRTFLRDKKWPMTMRRVTALPQVFLTNGVPATFVIAPDGRIAAMEEGAAQWDDPSAVDFLERLARETPGGP